MHVFGPHGTNKLYLFIIYYLLLLSHLCIVLYVVITELSHHCNVLYCIKSLLCCIVCNITVLYCIVLYCM